MVLDFVQTPCAVPWRSMRRLQLSEEVRPFQRVPRGRIRRSRYRRNSRCSCYRVKGRCTSERWGAWRRPRNKSTRSKVPASKVHELNIQFAGLDQPLSLKISLRAEAQHDTIQYSTENFPESTATLELKYNTRWNEYSMNVPTQILKSFPIVLRMRAHTKPQPLG